MKPEIEYCEINGDYFLCKTYYYTDPTNGERITIRAGRCSDGATGAIDVGSGWFYRIWEKVKKFALAKCIGCDWLWRILKKVKTAAWFVHDEICLTGRYDSGVKITNFQASQILCRILWNDGYYIRAFSWFLPTFLFGGGQCRKNGLWRVKNG